MEDGKTSVAAYVFVHGMTHFNLILNARFLFKHLVLCRKIFDEIKGSRFHPDHLLAVALSLISLFLLTEFKHISLCN